MNIHSENTPEQPEISDGAGPSLDLDVGTTVTDGLSKSNQTDPVNSNDADIVEVSDLQRFASALQEAQCAAQLEKAKQKWTYQGNSRTTVYRHEKACKELAV